jgi:hypothetical protein
VLETANLAKMEVFAARNLLRWNGWKLKVVKRKQRAFKTTHLTESRSEALLGTALLPSQHILEHRVQTAELMIESRPAQSLAVHKRLFKHPLSNQARKKFA